MAEDGSQNNRRPIDVFGEVMFGTPLNNPDKFTERETREEMTRGERLTQDSTAVRGPTRHQQLEAEQEWRDSAPSTWEAAKTSMDIDWTTSLVSEREKNFEPDPHYVTDPEFIEELSKGYPEDMIDYVVRGESKDEQVYLAERYKKRHQEEQDFAKLGLWKSLSIRGGLTMLDPGAWGIAAGASYATGGASAAVMGAKKVSRMRRIVQGAVAGAGGNLAAEMAVRENSPIYNDMNLLWSAGAGLALGGGFSALARNPSTAEEAGRLAAAGRNMQTDAELAARGVAEQEAVAAGSRPTQTGELNFNAKNGKPFQSEQAIKNSKRFRETPFAQIVETDGGYAWRVEPPEEPTQQMAGGDVGAAEVPSPEGLRPDDASIDEFLSLAKRDPSVAPRTGKARLFGVIPTRWSSMATGKTNDNPGVRALFNVQAEDGVGQADRSIATPIGASERQVRMERSWTSDWLKNEDINFKKWLEENNIRPNFVGDQSKTRLRRQFHEQVTDAKEGLTDNPSPAARAQADVAHRIAEQIRVRYNNPRHEMGENARPLKGAGTLEEDPYWMPHEPDFGRIMVLDQEIGTNQLRRLLAEDIDRPDLTAKQRMTAADAYIKTAKKIRAGMGNDTGRVLSSGDAEEIKRFLRDNAEGMNEAEVGDIVDALTLPQSQGGKAGKSKGATGTQHLKRRTPLKMNTKQTLWRSQKFGGGRREVSVREMFNRNAHELMTSYIRRSSGAIAMGQMRIPGLADGITSRAEHQTVMNKIRDIAVQEGYDIDDTNAALKQADWQARSIYGIPNEGDFTGWSQANKYFRDWSTLRFMGQVGWAQVPEVGVTMSAIGLTNIADSVPAYRELWRSAQDGSLGGGVVDELATRTGLGDDNLRGGVVDRYNDMTGQQDTRFNLKPAQQGFEEFTQKAKKFTFQYSGMIPINTVLNRTVMKGVTNKFIKAAFDKGGNETAIMTPQRLRSLGMDKETVQKVMKNMQTHATVRKGQSGTIADNLNLDNWDLDAASAYVDAIHRIARRVVQENDVGQAREWMSGPTARSVLQFRTFIMGAHEKQLLHNLHMADVQTATTFISTTFLAGLAYMGREKVASLGKEDPEGYLEERLSKENIAKASFERSSWAGVIPAAIDSVLPGAQFTFRTTDQTTDAAFGNPPADTLNTLVEAAQGLPDGINSQEEIRNLYSLVPGNNFHGVGQFLSYLTTKSDLPEREYD